LAGGDGSRLQALTAKIEGDSRLARSSSARILGRWELTERNAKTRRRAVFRWENKSNGHRATGRNRGVL